MFTWWMLAVRVFGENVLGGELHVTHLAAHEGRPIWVLSAPTTDVVIQHPLLKLKHQGMDCSEVEHWTGGSEFKVLMSRGYNVIQGSTSTF
jgi:hypothetical protein